MDCPEFYVEYAQIQHQRDRIIAAFRLFQSLVNINELQDKQFLRHGTKCEFLNLFHLFFTIAKQERVKYLPLAFTHYYKH